MFLSRAVKVWRTKGFVSVRRQFCDQFTGFNRKKRRSRKCGTASQNIGNQLLFIRRYQSIRQFHHFLDTIIG